MQRQCEHMQQPAGNFPHHPQAQRFTLLLPLLVCGRLLPRKEAAERKAFPVAARNANDGLTIRYASVVGTQAVTRER